MLKLSDKRAWRERGFALTLAVVLVSAASVASGAPLSKGTLLTIKQGRIGYPEGTCFGSYVRNLNDAINCYPIGPGVDGGLVVGKNQISGGQEQGTNGREGRDERDGELSNAFSRLGYATLATAPMQGAMGGNASTDASLNRFDDVSCNAAVCLGKVEINTLHQAYNGHVIPGGCASADCAATGGSGVKSWVVNTDRTYQLDAMWGLVQVHLEGSIVLPGNTPPQAEPVNVGAVPGKTVLWQPLVYDADNDKLSCALLPGTSGFYGSMTLAADCSSGMYTPPNPLFSGRECRQYQVSDGKNVSVPVAICIKISVPKPVSKRRI